MLTGPGRASRFRTSRRRFPASRPRLPKTPTQSRRSSPMTMLAAALRLADADWPIFPLNGKVLVGGHGHLDATTDRGQVTAWWTEYPDANIGGRVPEGRIVLDVDPRHEGDK